MKKLVSSGLFPLFVTVAAGPLFVFPRQRWLWPLLLVPLVWLVRPLFGFPMLRRTPADFALAVLVVWVFIGTLRLPEVGPSVEKLAGFVYGLIFFYTVLEAARRPGRLKAGIALFLTAGAVVAVVGTLGRWMPAGASSLDSSKARSGLPRLEMNITEMDMGVNPNPLGGTLVLFIPLGLALVPRLRDKPRRPALVFVAAVVAVELAAILLTRSFGAWAALFFSLLILGREKRLLKAIAGIGLIAAAAFLWLRIDRPMMDADKSFRGTLAKSVHSRFSVWAAGVEAAGEEPLFGIGLDRFRLREGIDYDLAHAHNQYLHTAAETGMPGLAAYLAILIAAGWMAVRTGHSHKPTWMKSASLGLAVGQVGFAVFGLADAIVLGAKPGLFFWISLGLIAAIYLFEESEEEEPLCS